MKSSKKTKKSSQKSSIGKLKDSRKPKIITAVVPGYKAKGIKGGLINHIAMKNKNSFLVGIDKDLIKLVEDGTFSSTEVPWHSGF